MTNQVNWSAIFNGLSDLDVERFASGILSGENLYQTALDWGDDASRSEIRRMLRNRGVVESRQLARKALRRRGVRV